MSVIHIENPKLDDLDEAVNKTTPPDQDGAWGLHAAGFIGGDTISRYGDTITANNMRNYLALSGSDVRKRGVLRQVEDSFTKPEIGRLAWLKDELWGAIKHSTKPLTVIYLSLAFKLNELGLQDIPILIPFLTDLLAASVSTTSTKNQGLLYCMINLADSKKRSTKNQVISSFLRTQGAYMK